MVTSFEYFLQNFDCFSCLDVLFGIGVFQLSINKALLLLSCVMICNTRSIIDIFFILKQSGCGSGIVALNSIYL